MRLVRELLVAVCGLSTILVGIPSLFAADAAQGIARTQLPDLDAADGETASLESLLDSEPGPGDDSHTRTTIACDPAGGFCWSPAVHRLHGEPVGSNALPTSSASDFIRGPPARG